MHKYYFSFIFLLLGLFSQALFADDLDLDRYVGPQSYSLKEKFLGGSKINNQQGSMILKDHVVIPNLDEAFDRYVFIHDYDARDPYYKSTITVYRSPSSGKYFSFAADEIGVVRKSDDFKLLLKPGTNWVELKKVGNTLKGVFYPQNKRQSRKFSLTFDETSVVFRLGKKETTGEKLGNLLIPFRIWTKQTFTACDRLI